MKDLINVLFVLTMKHQMYKQHILNYHSSKEQREEDFKYYCKLCNYGSFSKDLLEKHNLTEKHKKHEYNLNYVCI